MSRLVAQADDTIEEVAAAQHEAVRALRSARGGGGGGGGGHVAHAAHVVAAPGATSYVGSTGGNGPREDLSGVQRLLEGALAPTPTWVRDVIGMHLRSCDRVRGVSPSLYTLKLPMPVPKATTVQLSSISLPTQAIYNVDDPVTRIPVGVPLQPVDVSAPLALTFVVQWRAITPVHCAQLARALRAQLPDAPQGGAPFASVTFDDVLQLIDTTAFSIVLPAKLNPLTDVALDPLAPDDYVRMTTLVPHGLAVALRSFRRLGLGARLAGTLLQSGVPELLPPLATLIAAGIDLALLPSLLEVVDDVTFRVHRALLALYYYPAGAGPTTQQLRDAVVGGPGAVGSYGPVHLVGDMCTLPDLLFALNDALDVARRAPVDVAVPAAFNPPGAGASVVQSTFLPDEARFQFHARTAHEPARTVMTWTPGSPVSDYVLAGNVQYESSVIARLESVARAASGAPPFLVGVLNVDAAASALATYLGFPGALATPPASAEYDPDATQQLLPVFSYAKLLCAPLAAAVSAANGVAGASGFVARAPVAGGLAALGTSAARPRGWAAGAASGAYGPRANLALAGVPRDVLASAPTQYSQVGVFLSAGACDGDFWRRDVQMRPGRYEEPGALAAMINERARGLTFAENDPRTVYVGDLGASEIAVVVPPGDYDDEQLRTVLQAALRDQTEQPNFQVDYVAAAVQAIGEGVNGGLAACATTEELVDTTVGNGYPRRTKWRIANAACPFSLRFEGAWARRMGFLRATYRDAAAYVGEEFAVEPGLPFDFNVNALIDAEAVARLRFSASTPQLIPSSGGTPAPSRGFHRAAFAERLPSPPAPPPGPFSVVLMATVVPDVPTVPLVLGRVRAGDAYAIKLTAPRRVLTVVLADAYDPASTGILAPYMAIAPSPALAEFVSTSSGSNPFVEPVGAYARFCLLFALAPRVTPYDTLGFAPLVYPLDARLLAGCPAAAAVTNAANAPALERTESALKPLFGALYCSGGNGVVSTERCIAAISASPALLGDDDPQALADPEAAAAQRADAVLARLGALVTASAPDGALSSGDRRRVTTLLMHDVMSAMRSGAGGGAANHDGKRLSVISLEAPFPLRLDYPRVLFLRIAMPGADNTRTQKYSTLVEGSQLYFFTKLSIGRGNGYMNISEQLMHTDLGSMNDVDEFIISWYKDDMTPVDFHGLEHDFTLLFSIRDAHFVTGTQA